MQRSSGTLSISIKHPKPLVARGHAAEGPSLRNVNPRYVTHHSQGSSPYISFTEVLKAGVAVAREIIGTGGNNRLEGGDRGDDIYGRDGNDDIFGRGGDDNILAGAVQMKS